MMTNSNKTVLIEFHDKIKRHIFSVKTKRMFKQASRKRLRPLLIFFIAVFQSDAVG